jgi:hypothetical protein
MLTGQCKIGHKPKENHSHRYLQSQQKERFPAKSNSFGILSLECSIETIDIERRSSKERHTDPW